MRCRVEVPVVVSRLVQNVHVVVGCRAPFDQRQHGSRVRLDHDSILIDPTKNGRTDRKHEAGRAVTRSGEDVMNQPPMKPAIAVGKGMDVDESERDGGSRGNGIDTTSDRTTVVRNGATEKVSEILRPRADVVGDGFLRVPVVRPHEATFISEPEFHKTRIANDHTLKPFQFVNRNRMNARLPNCAGPPRGSGARRAFTLNREGRLRVAEQKKCCGSRHKVLSCATDDFASAGVGSFRDGSSKVGRPPDHGTKAARSWQIVDDLVARRGYALPQGHLLVWVDDCYDANLAGIWYVELKSGQPLVEKPGPACKGACWRCPRNRRDFVGLHHLEESGQDAEIDAFPLQRENELALERIGRTMTRCQQQPGQVRCRVMALGNNG